MSSLCGVAQREEFVSGGTPASDLLSMFRQTSTCVFFNVPKFRVNFSTILKKKKEKEKEREQIFEVKILNLMSAVISSSPSPSPW